ncbi:glycosyltransferase family 10 domain-containing protein [Parabacteroides sp. AM08-6]|uniref:glycosyltransferase family 10 domain-containing protein n=1 Tax=Parabacteroides sp. AM08-6 TaxID=2292053 RepID=UPI0011C3B36D|nr:glycosyltransferase family 10 [Parabacteroides sp. AM08-6]
MKKIKINFVDFWDGFNCFDNYFVNILTCYYDVEIDAKPDYLFYSVFGDNHLEYKNCIKIYYTGENDFPDFNFCDYAIGFQYFTFEDRSFRYPEYLLYEGYNKLMDKEKTIDKLLSNRKFCNFVYSNSKYAIPLREKFFHQLSKYKKVDSGGRLLNNVGGPVQNKLDFIKDYKFTIAFENSSLSGYTTEKLMEPMVVNSLPIYWGNPNVHLDFNVASIINLQSFSSFEEAIEEIVRLDNDDDAYLQKLSQPWLTQDQAEKNWEKELALFLCNIFDQPIEKARRRTDFGFGVMKKFREARFSRFLSYSIFRRLLNF